MSNKVEKEITVQAPWGKIRALSWGDENNPPVIICHGRQDTGAGFRPLVRLLPDCFFYVAVDLPGNGRSDHFPGGVMFTVMDFVQTVVKVREHYKWKNFIYMGHSLGALIGKWFNIAYPGVITRVIELDPTPAYHTYDERQLEIWYNVFYHVYYTNERYKKANSSKETAPKYTYEKALNLIMVNRNLKKEAAEHVLERTIEPAGDGLYRFTHDQRMRDVPRYPFAPGTLLKMYTIPNTPILAIIAQGSIDFGYYIKVPFVLDESAWPNGNFQYKIVPGGHDVHINNPDCLAGYVSDFLMEGYKAKL